MLECSWCSTKMEKYYCEEFKVCEKCYNKFKICIKCGNLRPVESNTKNGPVCKKCYKTPIEICSICNKLKNVRCRIDGKPLCDNCYSTRRKKLKKPNILCVLCDEIKPEYRHTKCGHICFDCYMNPIKKCCICGEYDVVNLISEKGPICKECYEQPIVQCSRCPNIKNVAKRDENGKPLCINCYLKERKENDFCFDIKEKLRKSIQNVFKKYSEEGKKCSTKQYGIDIMAIVLYLGPCPGNRENYHIDHILPLSAFDFNNPIHIKAAFAPENHQWLPKEENMKKGSKYNIEKFKEYINAYMQKLSD